MDEAPFPPLPSGKLEVTVDQLNARVSLLEAVLIALSRYASPEQAMIIRETLNETAAHFIPLYEGVSLETAENGRESCRAVANLYSGFFKI